MIAFPERSAPAFQSVTASPRCREIISTDLDGVINLLNDGFRPPRGTGFWRGLLAALGAREPPPGFPQYGYLLENDGKPVGALLSIFSAVPTGGGDVLRCNVSSWYVEPAFRTYAAMLVSRVLRHKDVTYLNITSAPHTRRILEAQGYTQYCSGVFAAFPLLGRWPLGGRIEQVSDRTRPGDGLLPSDIAILRDHARFGCISVVCSVGGVRYPFVFAPRRKRGILPFAFLVYCRGTESFVTCAAPIGRFLALRATPLVVLDADGPVPGLVGWYRGTNPKYFKGPCRPALGDVAYTERAILGV
jgi:hypothetical protein